MLKRILWQIPTIWFLTSFTLSWVINDALARIFFSISGVTIFVAALQLHRQQLNRIRSSNSWAGMRDGKDAPRFLMDVIAFSALGGCANTIVRTGSMAPLAVNVLIAIGYGTLLAAFLVSVLRQRRSIAHCVVRTRKSLCSFREVIEHPNFDTWARENSEQATALCDDAFSVAKTYEASLSLDTLAKSISGRLFERFVVRIGFESILLSPEAEDRTYALVKLLSWFSPPRRREGILADLAVMTAGLRDDKHGEFYIRLMIIYHLGTPIFARLAQCLLLLRSLWWRN